MTERPFRELCEEADLRDSMTEDEFWGHVLGRIAAAHRLSHLDDDECDVDEAIPYLLADPCEVCGATGACAIDSEGRPLIHTTTQGDTCPS